MPTNNSTVAKFEIDHFAVGPVFKKQSENTTVTAKGSLSELIAVQMPIITLALSTLVIETRYV